MLLRSLDPETLREEFEAATGAPGRQLVIAEYFLADELSATFDLLTRERVDAVVGANPRGGAARDANYMAGGGRRAYCILQCRYRQDRQPDDVWP